jgi:tripartite-type tricarboxylate transporter receptor subunit TctC
MGGKLGHIAWVAAFAICAQIAGTAPSFAQADDFPNRPVRIIVGPSPDVFARIIAEHLQ